LRSIEMDVFYVKYQHSKGRIRGVTPYPILKWLNVTVYESLPLSFAVLRKDIHWIFSSCSISFLFNLFSLLPLDIIADEAWLAYKRKGI
jgi:hypothetical protein